MGGLLVLAIIPAYVWVVYKSISRVNPKWGKALLILVFALVPTADAIYGRIRLQQMCAAEGGLKIYRVVEGVEGFDEPSSRPDDEWILKYGYRFVEGEELGGERSRISLQPDGKIVRDVGVTPIAEYIFEWDKGNSRDVFDRSGTHIRIRSTSEILSRYVNINYAGGWFERFVSGLYASRGTAGMCGPVVSLHEIVTKTLKPIK